MGNKRKDGRKRLERTGISIPTILVAALDARAASLGMSRSHYVTHVLASEEKTQLVERLERAERRIKELASNQAPPTLRYNWIKESPPDQYPGHFEQIPAFGEDGKVNLAWYSASHESQDGNTFYPRFPGTGGNTL